MSLPFPPEKQPCDCGYFVTRGLSIDAIIISEKEEILLIKRGNEPFKGSWALVGGYVDWNEEVEEAVKREVEEEVGLKVISLELLGEYSKPNRHPQQTINLAYSVQVKGSVTVGDDAVEGKYFPLNDLPQELAFDHKQIIDDYLKKKS